MKKTSICICLLSVIFFIYSPHVTKAKDPNVADCLEKGDCHDKDDASIVETDEGSEPETFKKTGSLIFDLVKMIFALLLVLGLIYLLLKILSRRNRLFQQVKGLENLGGISVGQNKSIQIIRVGTNMYMIGVGENVEMLEKITDEQMKKELLQNDEMADEPGKPMFPSLFQQKQKEQKKEEKQNQSFQKLFASEVRKMQQARKRIIHEQTDKVDENE